MALNKISETKWQGGKYLLFEDHGVAERRKTHTYSVTNASGLILGDIIWSTGWRQYVFIPWGYTQYSQSCLDDIAKFLVMATTFQRSK